MINSLVRFEEAHREDFQRALSEIRNGKKVSHWMWYVFPQIKGLGFSETSKYYSIENMEEAQEFLNHPVLGKNIFLISSELLKLKTNNATSVFGKSDDIKLQSSMTLFSSASESGNVFQKVLDKFFNAEADQKTLLLLK